MAATRKGWPAGTVGHPYVIGIPVLDENGVSKSLDGLVLTCKATDPSANVITPTIAQRVAGSHLMDVTITGAQMTTGGTSEDNTGTSWKVDVYIAGESGGERPLGGRFQFIAEAKETEA